MKIFLSSLYALLVSVVILALLYFVSPYVVEHPKIASCLLAFFMIIPIGVSIRSAIELYACLPMAMIAGNNNKTLVLCPVVFIVALIVAIAIPWFNGVSGWNTWQWISSIVFSVFNFETFFAFVGASLRAYNN